MNYIKKDITRNVSDRQSAVKNEEVKFPCKACIKRGLHCCKNQPVFSNEEAANLIDSEIFEKLNKKLKLMVVRYTADSDLWLFIPSKYRGKEYKMIKKFEKEEKNCFFFDKAKGCLIGNFKPAICKEIRNPESPIFCRFAGMSEEELQKENIQTLLKRKSDINVIAFEKMFTKIYGDYLNRPFPRLKMEFDNPKNLKYTQDELFFTFIDYIMRLNAKTNNPLMSVKERKRLVVDKRGEVTIYTDYYYQSLSEDINIKIFTKKMNNIISTVFGTFVPAKIDILSRKITSVLKGLHKTLTEDFVVTDLKGFLLATLLLRIWQDNRKGKDKRFAGVFTRKEVEDIGNTVVDFIDGLEISDEEFDKAIEETTEFAKALFKAFFNQKI